jgi:hypothetical protein
MVRTSTDGGRTWSEARRLPEWHPTVPIKNKPVQLADGTILSPTSNETDERPSKWTRATSSAARMAAGLGPRRHRCTTASRYPRFSPASCSTIGLAARNCRRSAARGRGRFSRCRPTTAGKTWSEIALLDVPNPSSGTDAVTLKDGRHLLDLQSGAERPDAAGHRGIARWPGVETGRDARRSAGRIFLSGDHPDERRSRSRHLHVETRAGETRRASIPLKF